MLRNVIIGIVVKFNTSRIVNQLLRHIRKAALKNANSLLTLTSNGLKERPVGSVEGSAAGSREDESTFVRWLHHPPTEQKATWVNLFHTSTHMAIGTTERLLKILHSVFHYDFWPLQLFSASRSKQAPMCCCPSVKSYSSAECQVLHLYCVWHHNSKLDIRPALIWVHRCVYMFVCSNKLYVKWIFSDWLEPFYNPISKLQLGAEAKKYLSSLRFNTAELQDAAALTSRTNLPSPRRSTCLWRDKTPMVWWVAEDCRCSWQHANGCSLCSL